MAIALFVASQVFFLSKNMSEREPRAFGKLMAQQQSRCWLPKLEMFSSVWAGENDSQQLKAFLEALLNGDFFIDTGKVWNSCGTLT